MRIIIVLAILMLPCTCWGKSVVPPPIDNSIQVARIQADANIDAAKIANSDKILIGIITAAGSVLGGLAVFAAALVNAWPHNKKNKLDQSRLMIEQDEHERKRGSGLLALVLLILKHLEEQKNIAANNFHKTNIIYPKLNDYFIRPRTQCFSIILDTFTLQNEFIGLIPKAILEKTIEVDGDFIDMNKRNTVLLETITSAQEHKQYLDSLNDSDSDFNIDFRAEEQKVQNSYELAKSYTIAFCDKNQAIISKIEELSGNLRSLIT